MEPNNFFFLILPLATLGFVLAGVLLYTKSRSGEDEYERKLKKIRRLMFLGKVDRKTYINLSRRLRYVKHFNSESSKLPALLSDEKIDKGTYVRLRHILETTFKKRLDKLDDSINEVGKEKPFDAAKF